MNLLEAIKERHSVRSYTTQAIDETTVKKLQDYISECNEESNLHIQLYTNEADAFTGLMARYGKFKNVNNYIALVGKKDESLNEKCGYYGEKIVLYAQQLGLNTCWVGGTYKKSKTKVQLNQDEKMVMIISIGYGENKGHPHKSKNLEVLADIATDTPEWFIDGMKAVQLAPTALNQQKFHFSLHGDQVIAKPGNGFYTVVDLGIAKYHFEIGATEGQWHW